MTHTQDSLEVSQQIPAKREQVFAAWAGPAPKDWFAPEDMQIVSAEADVRVGGKFRLSMKGQDGQVHTCYGKYEEVVPDQRVVFTHQWEGQKPVETRVTVKFEDDGPGTKVTLQQEGFEDPAEAKGHAEGWASTLRSLAKQFPKAKTASQQPR